MKTLQTMETSRRTQPKFKTTTCLTLLMALLLSTTLMPAAAYARKKHGGKKHVGNKQFVNRHPVEKEAVKPTSLYRPPGKLLHDRHYAPEVKVELTATGKALADKYAAMIKALRAELVKQLPQIDSAKQKACMHALAAQLLASVDLRIADTKYRRGYSNRVKELASAQHQPADKAADKLAAAKLALKQALAMPDSDPDKALAVAYAKKRLAHEEKDASKGSNKIADLKAAIERSKKNEPELMKQVNDANKAYAQAEANSAAAFKALGVDGLLASNALDAKLAKFAVLTDEGPYWLAVYAQQGPDKQKILDQLLSDPQLMIQMLVADGPQYGKYGRAMEVYQNILKVSPDATSGLFHRLALAVALSNAQPMVQTNPESDKNAPQYVDPVKRYLSYKKAYLAHELDPAFAGFSTWDLRWVVNDRAPDKILAWGRKMLHNYRPDLITMKNDQWRYVKSVNTSVQFTSYYQHLGWDQPDLNWFQNILANGGVCGRRAQFGRFILRAFGIPTVARPQPGHASLVRWTPDGWVDCLGGGWGASTRGIGGYPTGLDFLASTQARQDKQGFMEVKRAEWIGQAFGEAAACGYHINLRLRDEGSFAKQSVDEIENQDIPGFWHCAAMIKQNMIIKKLKGKVLAAASSGQNSVYSYSVKAVADLGEADAGEGEFTAKGVKIPASQRQITVGSDGTIHIPAAATSQPTNNTRAIHFMPSDLGGWQLVFSRYGGAATFQYTFDAPRAGKYQLTARLVTPAPKQHLYLEINDAKQPINIALPDTVGIWGKLKPVEIELAKGKNVLTFSHNLFFPKGVAIHDFTLTPVH